VQSASLQDLGNLDALLSRETQLCQESGVMSVGTPLMLSVHMLSLLLTPLPVHVWSFEHVPLLLQALSKTLPGDASIHLLLGMLRNAKGNKEAAANAYAAAVRISLVSACRSPCHDSSLSDCQVMLVVGAHVLTRC